MKNSHSIELRGRLWIRGDDWWTCKVANPPRIFQVGSKLLLSVSESNPGKVLTVTRDCDQNDDDDGNVLW